MPWQGRVHGKALKIWIKGKNSRLSGKKEKEGLTFGGLVARLKTQKNKKNLKLIQIGSIRSTREPMNGGVAGAGGLTQRHDKSLLS
jgi:hypothetical protein